MSLYDRIKALCDEHKIAVTKLESELGFARGSIGKLRNQKGTNSERVETIAGFFGVSVDYLMTGEEKNGPVLTEQEKRLLENFRALSENGKRIIEETSKALSDVSGNVHSA